MPFVKKRLLDENGGDDILWENVLFGRVGCGAGVLERGITEGTGVDRCSP